MKDKDLILIPDGEPEIVKDKLVEKCHKKREPVPDPDDPELLATPLPLILQNKEGCGNFFVASRQIEKGELIFEENTLSVSAYGTVDKSPFCLSCYKDLAYSQKCKLCRWPVCNEKCSAAPQHSNYECQFLAANKVKFQQGKTMAEYLGIETLRCLLLRDRNIPKWEQIIRLEAHLGPRSEQSWALIEMLHVANFIRERCKLIEFDDATIIRVLGVICINTFNGLAYTGRYVSLLFARASLFNHNCTPNTIRKFSEIKNELTGALKFSIKIFAAQEIQSGEVISTNYGDMTAEIVNRACFLKDHFFFHCDCHRCRFELFNEIQYFVPELMG